MWTRFMDMYSGGSRKTAYDYIYIEADEETTTDILKEKLDRFACYVTCECCGEDYAVRSDKDIEDLSHYERRGEPLDRYKLRPDVKLIAASEI